MIIVNPWLSIKLMCHVVHCLYVSTSQGFIVCHSLIMFLPNLCIFFAVMVQTLAGSGDVGLSDGLGTLSSFKAPVRIVIDKFSNLFIADIDAKNVRMINNSSQGIPFCIM